jgi:aspartate/methionine/tyrosine aminotransferase
MNELAEGLNRTLAGTAAGRLLSDLGRRLYFPKGIVAQSAEAARHARRLNATAGMARRGGEALHLGAIRELLPGLDPEEIVAYAPTAGLAELRELWRAELARKNPALAGRQVSLPSVVSGLTHGVSLAADLFADPGQVVLIPEPYWGNYRLIFEERRQARLRPFPLLGADRALNIPGLAEALAAAPGERLIVLLNFPQNPTGYSPSREEAAGVLRVLREEAARGRDLLLLLDDAYFGLFYEPDLYPQSLFAEAAGLHENLLAVKIDGATKEELAWGLRVGFVTFGGAGLEADQLAALENKLLGAIRSSVSSGSRLSQSLLARALRSPSHGVEIEAATQVLRERYRRSREILARLRGPLEPLPFNSGYFLCFELSEGGAEALRLRLLHEHGIGTVSIQDRYLRVAYSTVDTERLEELYTTIYRVAGERPAPA